jgi:hypothetical protein
MATSEVTKPQDNEDTRGLTLRELVLEVRNDLKDVKIKFGMHILEHAEVHGRAQGEARLFGIARSSLAVIVSVASGVAAIWGILH